MFTQLASCSHKQLYDHRKPSAHTSDIMFTWVASCSHKQHYVHIMMILRWRTEVSTCCVEN